MPGGVRFGEKLAEKYKKGISYYKSNLYGGVRGWLTQRKKQLNHLYAKLLAKQVSVTLQTDERGKS